MGFCVRILFDDFIEMVKEHLHSLLTKFFGNLVSLFSLIFVGHSLFDWVKGSFEVFPSLT